MAIIIQYNFVVLLFILFVFSFRHCTFLILIAAHQYNFFIIPLNLRFIVLAFSYFLSTFLALITNYFHLILLDNTTKD